MDVIEELKAIECPTCGSSNIIFETTVEDVEFRVNNEGKIKVDVAWRIKNNVLNEEYVLCTCNSCGESWDLNL